MKKIPIQITDDNVKYVNNLNISFSKIVNFLLDKSRKEKKLKKEDIISYISKF